MADMITMPDGRTEIVFGIRDFLTLVDRYMGFEAKRWIEAKLAEVQEAWDAMDDMEKDLELEREGFRNVICEIREESETLAGLVSERCLDRKRISETAGRIGGITWKKL